MTTVALGPVARQTVLGIQIKRLLAGGKKPSVSALVNEALGLLAAQEAVVSGEWPVASEEAIPGKVVSIR